MKDGKENAGWFLYEAHGVGCCGVLWGAGERALAGAVVTG